MHSSTEWFRNARWGVLTHYLADVASNHDPIDLSVDAWNRRVDSFDVGRLAGQLESVGAHYYIITLGQNSGFWCTPNATYDSFVGRTPSRCAQRDLIADLAEVLAPRGITLMVYATSHAPVTDPMAIDGLDCKPTWDAAAWGPLPIAPGPETRLPTMQRRWEAVLREWSERWGRNVAGWWIDGCYFADRMYRHPDPPNFQSFAAALKAGNPDSLVAFNPGVKVPVISHTEWEDYTAGEISTTFPVTAPRLEDGVQYHILSYMGDAWGSGSPRFGDAFVRGVTEEINRVGGVMTWDVPILPDGAIPPAFLDQLRVLKS